VTFSELIYNSTRGCSHSTQPLTQCYNTAELCESHSIYWSCHVYKYV